METKLALATPADPSAAGPAGGRATRSSPAPGLRDDTADLRLVIEQDPGTGGYIYKTIDRMTGAVVSELPREDVMRLQASADYRPGAVIKAKA